MVKSASSKIGGLIEAEQQGAVFETCAAEDSRERELAHILKPEEDDFFILKPRHSAFYSANLEILLRVFNTTSLVLTGIAGNICVLFTANDAHMRDYNLWIPQDCVASNSASDKFRQCFAFKNLGIVLSDSVSLRGTTKCSKILKL